MYGALPRDDRSLLAPWLLNQVLHGLCRKGFPAREGRLCLAQAYFVSERRLPKHGGSFSFENLSRAYSVCTCQYAKRARDPRPHRIACTYPQPESIVVRYVHTSTEYVQDHLGGLRALTS